jgi:gliding motility-associated-like protein
MRTFYLILLLTCCAKPASCQFYEIFGREDVDICDTLPYFYTIETSELIQSTIWTISPSPGAIIISQDVNSANVQYYTPGTYILVASSLSVNGNILTDSVIIYAFGHNNPLEVIGCNEVDSTKGCYQVCAFSQTIIQSDPGSFFQWNVTGAQSVTQTSSSYLEIIWGPGGPGIVSLYSQGCDQTLCFDILPLPVADFATTPLFNGDTLTVCKNQEVYFENLSFNGISYTWFFGDGSQSGGYDASHTYTNEGFYTVTLLADNICDCSDEKQIVIEVLPTPAPTLECVNSVCPETRQRYIATPSGCSSYNWSVSSNGTIVNGGNPTNDFIEVIWHEGPDGFIDLQVSGCSTSFCSFTNTFRVPIITPDGPVDGDASVCSGEITTYTAPYFPGTQYLWQVGQSGTILGGQNTNGITVQWDNVNVTTSSSVDVQYNNCFLECAGNDALAVSITPQIRLNGDIQACQNQTATLMAEAGFGTFSPVNVSWHVEDAAGNILYTEPGLSSLFIYTFNTPPGEYAIVATNSDAGYCTETLRRTIVVTAIPDVPLGIHGEQKICPGQLYGYTIESAGNFATQWVVTDGASIFNFTGQSFQHTFGPIPPYMVEAVHTDIQFQSCVSDPVTLILGTAVDLSISGPDDGCFNAIDTYTTSLISGADYTWEIIPADHGEINKSDLNNVNVFWTQTGVATLRLHACGVSIDKAVFVHTQPVFNVLGPTATCANELVSITTDQPLLSHTWVNDNDVVLSALNNIQLPPGSFGVEVTDGFGCTNDQTIQINTYPAPTVHLSSAAEETYCATLPGGVVIVANTDGTDYSYTWYLDDVLIGPGGPVFIVNTFGAYHVEVTNQYGCKTVSQKISFINCCPPAICGAPIPGFPGSCSLISNDFSIAASETACNVHQYTPLVAGLTPGSINWYIRSNSEGSIAAINADVFDYTYSKPGFYHVVMTALLNGFPYDASICGHFQKLTDTIRAVADFKHEGICAFSPIVYEDLTTFLPGETISSWSWDFDDPLSGADNVSTDQNPSHIYNDAGTFEVTLTVTLLSGCTTTKKQMVTVSAGPTLTPVFDPTFCEDEAMSFQLLGQVYNVQWSFGDPGSGIENMAVSDSVLHTFELPGGYWVTVAAADIHTCMNGVSFMIDIVSNTLSGLINVDPITPLCAGDTATLTSPAGGVSWSWSSGETTSQIQVTESNQYNVLIRDLNNCTYTPPAVFIEVFPKPEVIIKAREIYGPNVYGPWSSSLEICYGTEYELSAFSTGNVSYHWTGGSVTQILQFTNEGSNLPPPGLNEYTVVTTDITSGCISDSSSILVEIFALPGVPVISLASGSGCSSNLNILQVNNPEAGVTYTWSDGQKGTSITVENAGAYLVTAVNQNGCIATSNVIIINPAAPVDQLPGGCFIECDPLTVCLPPMGSITSYIIYQNGVPYLSGTSWPADFVITDDGTYTIEITTPNGCIATSNPLDVILYPAIGSITVLTYYDTDGDGVISAADALLPGIPVEIISGDGLQTGMTITDGQGQFVFEDYPSSMYTARIDRTLLSSQYKVLIDSVSADIATCGDSIIVSLLLTDNCTVTGVDQFFELCPGDELVLGDSTWTESGIYEMHLVSVLGCDSVFQVTLTLPDSFEIIGLVWVDVDHNVGISPADTLIPGVSVVVANGSTGQTSTQITDLAGSVQAIYPRAYYQIYIDTSLLAANFTPVLFEALVSDTTCGSVTVEFLIESLCPPVFVIQNQSLCAGDSILVEGQWISDEGQYTFIHSDPVTLCDTVIDVFVTLPEAIVIQSEVDWNCETLGSINLDISGSGPFSVLWQQGVDGDSIVTGLPEGDYPVTITDANGCTVADIFSIVASPGWLFEVPSLYTIDEGDSVLITITGDIDQPGLSYIWTPAGILDCPTCPSSLAYPIQDTLITIQITDADSCVYNIETFIEVIPFISTVTDHIYVPNVFSPNGDGINDFWMISSRLDNTFVKELTIYDRWGNMLLYKSAFVLNTFEGWDGTFNGKSMNPNVFVYFASLTLGDGKEVMVRGDVMLVR